MASEGPLGPALAALDRTAADAARHPVVHGNGQALATVGRPQADGSVAWFGVWLGPDGVRFLGEPPAASGRLKGRPIAPATAELADRIYDAVRIYLERIEELDAELSETQQRGRLVPINEIWRLQRRAAALRAQIGRTMVALAELAGPYAEHFPGLPGIQATIEGELGRVQQLCANLQQALSDLILLRTADESNRIAEFANELARTSNRIAALANTSNIRMLGLTYIALVLGLVSAVVLFPNTAATILGMPSAAWVPGIWVDVALVLVAVIPLALILGRPWVRHLFADLPQFEARAVEGVADLPEVGPEPVPPARRPPRADATPLSGPSVGRP